MYIWGSHLLLPSSLHISKITGGRLPGPSPSYGTAYPQVHLNSTKKDIANILLSDLYG